MSSSICSEWWLLNSKVTLLVEKLRVGGATDSGVLKCTQEEEQDTWGIKTISYIFSFDHKTHAVSCIMNVILLNFWEIGCLHHCLLSIIALISIYLLCIITYILCWRRFAFNPLSAGIFTVLGLRLLEGRVLHKGAWDATLLGALLGVQDYKTVKFLCRV